MGQALVTSDPRLCVSSSPEPVADLAQVDIALFPGSHSSEAVVNKQLADKERVAAALENPSLLAVVNKCLAGNGLLA